MSQFYETLKTAQALEAVAPANLHLKFNGPQSEKVKEALLAVAGGILATGATDVPSLESIFIALLKEAPTATTGEYPAAKVWVDSLFAKPSRAKAGDDAISVKATRRRRSGGKAKK